jgi:hypothetical protein
MTEKYYEVQRRDPDDLIWKQHGFGLSSEQSGTVDLRYHRTNGPDTRKYRLVRITKTTKVIK